MYDLDKQFIFTHPGKTGGTSIEELFGFLKLREKHPKIHRFKHGTLEMHIDTVRSKGFNPDNFFKFSIIRNPWDRAVSFYNHHKYKAYYSHLQQYPGQPIPKYISDAQHMSFEQYITRHSRNFNSDVATKPYVLFQKKFCMDYIIRLESLEEDIRIVLDKLQLNLVDPVPHRNNSDSYITRQDYRNYYNSDSRALIARLFEWDIETFNYTF